MSKSRANPFGVVTVFVPFGSRLRVFPRAPASGFPHSVTLSLCDLFTACPTAALELTAQSSPCTSGLAHQAEGHSVCSVKIYKTDMYGRFVADVFYHPIIKKKEEIAEKGFFLNTQLLDATLADLTI